ncbi:hypothetical protein MGN70_011298 [Eutypa lata]|nr:hypothetical protein MGN70_011298 [Eutypa lata]
MRSCVFPDRSCAIRGQALPSGSGVGAKRPRGSWDDGIPVHNTPPSSPRARPAALSGFLAEQGPVGSSLTAAPWGWLPNPLPLQPRTAGLGAADANPGAKPGTASGITV